MCSWCWGFRLVWNELQIKLNNRINIRYILGGLAPDTDQVMTDTMQESIQRTWRKIQQHIPGTEFNYDFWTECIPRRSTYLSCRAVISARLQRPEAEKEMILAIQQAYYLQARNPSDIDVLTDCAVQLSLDIDRFSADIQSEQVNEQLNDEIHFSEAIGATGYPSLILEHDTNFHPINMNYNNSAQMLEQIENIISDN